jgi:HAD superfamily hydrolase (TIGR01549 family)
MFYKGLIFDLDNTLYSYTECHNFALEKCINYIINITNYSYKQIIDVYNQISRELKIELQNTASSHNKSIYFKKIIEKLEIDYSHFSHINDIYWSNFYEKIKPYDYVKEFLEWNCKLNIKIGIITDYETEYQIIKLEKLGILKYVDHIITSEEVGVEKPDSKIFYKMLDVMNLSSDSLILFGDNYDKDILGAVKFNILTYWINENNPEFIDYKNIFINFNNIFNDIVQLKKICKYCGERFDLVQAGGGNVSIKSVNLMFIKASGFNLTNVDETNGYVVVNNKLLIENIKKNDISDDITKYNYIGKKRSSIETFMHSILKKYTIHLHPIQINKILIAKNAKEIIKQICPSGLIIDYVTPGIKVCNEINKYYNNHEIIFLLNHGIIITCDSVEQAYTLLEDIIITFENFQNINFDKYKLTNKISNIINNSFSLSNITYLCEDKIVNDYLLNKRELFKMKISFPDAVIYCGVKMLFHINQLNEYIKSFNEPPIIIIENGLIYINSHNLQKCKEIEDVFKSNIMILDTDFNKNFLSFEEICFLKNWDSEKYRKNL